MVDPEWILAFVQQLRGDVVRGEATEAQFDGFMALRWDTAPESVGDIIVTYKRWRRYIEGGRTYGS